MRKKFINDGKFYRRSFILMILVFFAMSQVSWPTENEKEIRVTLAAPGTIPPSITLKAANKTEVVSLEWPLNAGPHLIVGSIKPYKVK